MTLVYQIDLGVTRLLWVGKERTIESFQGFFTTIGELTNEQSGAYTIAIADAYRVAHGLLTTQELKAGA